MNFREWLEKDQQEAFNIPPTLTFRSQSKEPYEHLMNKAVYPLSKPFNDMWGQSFTNGVISKIKPKRKIIVVLDGAGGSYEFPISWIEGPDPKLTHDRSKSQMFLSKPMGRNVSLLKKKP